MFHSYISLPEGKLIKKDSSLHPLLGFLSVTTMQEKNADFDIMSAKMGWNKPSKQPTSAGSRQTLAVKCDNGKHTCRFNVK